MKYQPQHDLIDPDVPAPKPEFDFDEICGSEISEPPDITYVIGRHGAALSQPGGHAIEAYPSTPTPWAKRSAILLAAAFVVMTAWNIYRFQQGPPAPPPPSPVQTKQALYLGVMKIDTYRRAHGATPNSLDDLDLPQEWFGYRRIDADHYALSFRANGAALEYDSRVPKASFFGEPQSILPNGGPQ